MNAVFKKAALGALLILGLSTGAAVAGPITETYNISGTFVDGEGSFSGTFTASGTVNSSNVFTSGSVTAADITVTSNKVGAFTFASIDYGNPASSYTIGGTLQQDYFQVSTPGGADTFRVYFSNAGLSTTSADILDTFSYDAQIAAGNREFASVTLTADPVPEPSSLALLAAGLVMLAGLFVYGRARKSVSAAA